MWPAKSKIYLLSEQIIYSLSKYKKVAHPLLTQQVHSGIYSGEMRAHICSQKESHKSVYRSHVHSS